MQRHLIGVISDTHGLLRKEVLRSLKHCELILHAGDIGNADILEDLNEIAPAIAVRGNIDNESWANNLRSDEITNFEGVSIYMLHDLEKLKIDPIATGVKILISGHSHEPLQKWVDKVLYLNPGSIGPKRFNLPVSMAFIEIEGNKVIVSFKEFKALSSPKLSTY